MSGFSRKMLDGARGLQSEAIQDHEHMHYRELYEIVTGWVCRAMASCDFDQTLARPSDV